jgi:hypothetical protein
VRLRQQSLQQVRYLYFPPLAIREGMMFVSFLSNRDPRIGSPVLSAELLPRPSKILRAWEPDLRASQASQVTGCRPLAFVGMVAGSNRGLDLENATRNPIRSGSTLFHRHFTPSRCQPSGWLRGRLQQRRGERRRLGAACPLALGKPSLVRIHDDLPGAIDIVWSLLEGLGVPIASRSAEEVTTVDVDGAGAE